MLPGIALYIPLVHAVYITYFAALCLQINYFSKFASLLCEFSYE